jgi:uncharacterized surface anchored protein
MKFRKLIAFLLALTLCAGLFVSSAYADETDENYSLNGIIIKIEDAVTHKMLPGARFAIYYSNEAMTGSGGTKILEIDSDASGVIRVMGLKPGWYTVVETIPSSNYQLSINNTQSVYIQPDATSVVEITFSDYRYGGLLVYLNDKDTGEPIPDAKFSVTDVTHNAAGNSADGVYTTDAQGEFYLENLAAGDYIITQLTAAQGYAMDSSPNFRTVRLQHNSADQSVYRAEFSNSPLGSLLIRVKDSVSKAPLADVKFKVTLSGGEDKGEYVTDAAGTILLSKIERGTYIITQISAPSGYVLESTAIQKYVNYVGTYAVDIENYRLGGLLVHLSDFATGGPIAGATFSVTAGGGQTVGTSGGLFETDAQGEFYLENLEAGDYIITQLTTPQGYALNSSPAVRTVTLTGEQSDKAVYRADFTNSPLGNLLIRVKDSVSKEALKDAVFNVKLSGGEDMGEHGTDANGAILLSQIPKGTYIITQVSAPAGYLIASNPVNKYVDYVNTYTVDIENKPKSGLYVVKYDAATKAPLVGAKFRVYFGSALYGTYDTNTSGEFFIPNLEPGFYTVTEYQAPQGYILDETSKTVQVTAEQLHKLEFENSKLASLQIIKTDEASGDPLVGANFRITKQDGAFVADVTTDGNGKASVPELVPGWYVISETKAPNGYVISEAARTVEVKSAVPTVATITNRAESNLEILKTDAYSHAPLKGATFIVERDNGERIGKYVTDTAGKILVSGLTDGTYVVSETIAPEGYILDSAPQTVVVKSGKLTVAEFTDKPLSGIEILKTDADTGAPLKGAVFTIERTNGERIGDKHTTDEAGKIIVSGLTEGVYVVSEIQAPSEYVLNSAPKTVDVKSNKLTVAEFENASWPILYIKKIDADTGALVAGAEFTVTNQKGELIATTISSSTEAVGIKVAPGVYTVTEVTPPEGYELNNPVQTVNVTVAGATVSSGATATGGGATFANKKLNTIEIVKLDATTRSPLSGATFAVDKANGEKVGTYRTDSAGKILISDLSEGTYVISETAAPNGYILDGTPRNVNVGDGKLVSVEVLNKAFAGLLIVKTDANTGAPLAGVVFDVRRADGQLVTGSILDGNQPNTEANSPNINTTGSHTTDANGQIRINGLPAGVYYVTETKALSGYELDGRVYSATVTPGVVTPLRVTNTPKSGLRIIKTDSLTGRGIYNVEFMVFDIGNNVVGTYYTDNEGIVDITGILEAGTYTIRETRAADGYYRDDTPRTIHFTPGQTTEIDWKNTPQLGQIQIVKKSADDNEINGLPAGSPLEGAVFEIYSYKSGNLADRVVSGADGRAVSNPLPLGRYTIKEVQAPKYYAVSDKVLDVTLEFATQILKLEFTDYAANTGVTIRKTGVAETMSGDTISYTIKEARNTGTTALTDFYWRDTLPTDAVRLVKIVTGTYNQSLKYKIMATTNKGDTVTIADNLSTTKNNVVDCAAASLGLASDEYVTSFSVMFGTVKAGFSIVLTPQVYVKVQPNLPNKYEFANKTDIGGKHGTEWVVGNNTWRTSVYAKQGKLPRTGY